MFSFMSSFASSDWISAIKNMSLEDIQTWLHRYSQLGPLPGISLPLLEAFLPILPLVVFVVANASAYGLWAGFFYSWIGVCVGAILVFLIARSLSNRYGDRIRRRYPKAEKFFDWVEHKGFTPIFLLSCFPFSPSVIVNISAGMSKIKLHTFLTAILLGKGVMIFILSFLGQDVGAMIEHPWRIVAAVAVLVVLWFAGRKLESKFT
jgi:uncharacterized membrane protein YdjX (TVP38/TMEM64 family)